MADAVGAIGRVREGRNGRLFLGTQDGFDLDQFAGGRPFHDSTLLSWRRSIERRARELANRRIPYIFFIVPDSPSVYPEELPGTMGEGFRAPGQIFLDAVGDIPGVTFVYPLPSLRSAKGGLEVFKKKDSHWTSFGSFIGYQSLMDALSVHVACNRLQPGDVHFGFRRSYGDLGSLMSPEQTEEVPVVTIAGPEPRICRQLDGINRQTATESAFEESGNHTRALFFRDSFMTDLAPYVARSFGALLTLGSTTRMMLDAVDAWGADIVISQVAERKLPFCESDHQLEGYEATYGTDYKSAHGRRLLQARIGLASDPSAALKLIEGDIEILNRNPEQAFSAAIVYEANAELSIAEQLVTSALSMKPDSASTLALASRCALGLGRPADAVRFAQRAVEGCPHNGYYQELYVYSLLQTHQSSTAMRVVEDVLLHIQDHPNLWYLAAILKFHGRSGELAFPCAQEATRLDPGNQVYHDLCTRLDPARGSAAA